MPRAGMRRQAAYKRTRSEGKQLKILEITVIERSRSLLTVNQLYQPPVVVFLTFPLAE